MVLREKVDNSLNFSISAENVKQRIKTLKEIVHSNTLLSLITGCCLPKVLIKRALTCG